jgi:hypothetical protein
VKSTRITGTERARAAITAVCLAGMLALASGCAMGPAEFKVVRATPMPPNSEPGAAVQATAVTTAPAGPRTASDSGPAALLTYTVQTGESLWRICRRILGDPWAYRQAAAANHVADPDRILPGQTLTLDPAWVRKTAIALPAPTPTAQLTMESGVPQETKPAAAKPAAKSALPAYPSRKNTAFSPGESLTFSVEYFGIAAGFATLAVEAGPMIHDRPTLHLVATARTHPAFEWFFKVRDRIESYFDSAGLFSWRYEKHLREGSYSNDSVILYDQIKQLVMKDEGRTSVPVPAWIQDVLSEFYYFRTLDFKIGDIVTIPVVADDGKAYELVVTILRRERVSVPAGTFNCIVVQPALKFEGLFQQRGTLLIWLTDDARHIPVLIKSQIIIGTIDIVLREATVVEK